MEESGGAEGEDRISALPDCLIHHILSFLPSTQEAIRTGILSKRWKNQWTRVPVLVFDYDTTTNFSVEDFARFIDSVLLQHDCSTINKLHLDYHLEMDVNFSSKLTFATRKNVEELILGSQHDDWYEPYVLPKFLSNNASLIKLDMIFCCFMDTWTINWPSLNALTIDGYSSNKLVANVLSGSPSLEFLEFRISGEGNYVIASKSLKIIKILTLFEDDISNHEMQISCPNLEELYIDGSTMSDKAIANVVSDCPLLHFLKLKWCCFDQLVIASKSLKKLVFRENTVSYAMEISCPNLEEFNFYGTTFTMLRLLSIPCVISATLDFGNEFPGFLTKEGLRGGAEDVSKLILDQLQNVKELTIGRVFIKILSDLEMGGLYYSWSNNKILTLHRPNFEHLPEIVCALRSSPKLERLIIKLWTYKGRRTEDLPDLNDPQENCWNSNRIVSSSLVSHLRTVKIVGLSIRDTKCKLVLDFIEFLLRNAGALEKLVLIISKDQGTDFALAVSQKVSSFRRCSTHAIIELLLPEHL